MPLPSLLVPPSNFSVEEGEEERRSPGMSVMFAFCPSYLLIAESQRGVIMMATQEVHVYRSVVNGKIDRDLLKWINVEPPNVPCLS